VSNECGITIQVAEDFVLRAAIGEADRVIQEFRVTRLAVPGRGR
jgi:uncharacterized protein (DUF1778 family)